MTLIKTNKTLKGHKLIALTNFKGAERYVKEIQKEFPDLKVSSGFLEWADKKDPDSITDDDWKTATILMTGSRIPEPKAAPNLQLVQLVSAGANHVLDTSLFKDTDVAFCTANGVHG